MILRDPVHGLVAFEGIAEQIVGGLLATRELQRLRNVSQLGLTSLVFPGAEHSRFVHALGSAHIMVRLLDRIQAVQNDLPVELRLDREAKADVLAAALLHDLGHGPFSHLFEEVLPSARRHEDWSIDIILDPSTDVNRVLRRFCKAMPDHVASMLRGKYRIGYLARAISGTLDVDRCDYLLRDSHMTGVSYGVYDLEWLLQALAFGRTQLDNGSEQWVLAIEGRKGLPPIEGFFLARQFMFQQVYHHKATRAAESLIRGIFIRIAELIRDGSAPNSIPSALRSAVRGEPVSLGDYLRLDDVQLLGCFRQWEDHSDTILSDYTTRLARRDLPKTVPLPVDENAAEKWEQIRNQAREVAKNHGFRSDLSVQLDVPVEIPYAEQIERSPEGLWVIIRHQPIRRLGDVSFLLGELRNKRIERPRLIFPKEIREKILLAIENQLITD